MNIFELLIVQPIFNLLMAFYAVIPNADFGIVIIIFTVLLRLAMHPLIKKQLHQTKAMRKLQPQLTEIKKRTKGNKQAQSLAMMELYKEHGVSPFRSIGIMVIQLPIFIALYYVIRIFSMERERIHDFTYGFLQNIDSIKHIVDNPSLFNEKFLGVIDLTHTAFSGKSVSIALIVIAALAAVGQFIQSKQTLPMTGEKKRLRDILREAGEGKQADQSEINSAIMGKMIYGLPVFMFFVMISLPGAISVYYLTTTIVAVIQQHYILKEDEEELEQLADRASNTAGKKATAKAKARVEAAPEATVTRIVAKGSRPSAPKSKSKSKRK